MIKNLADAYKAASDGVESWVGDKVPEPVQGAGEAAKTGYDIYNKLSEAEEYRNSGEYGKEGEAASEAAADMLDYHPLSWFDLTGDAQDPLKERIKETGKILGGYHDYIEDIIGDAEGHNSSDNRSREKDPTHPYRPHPEESPTQAYTKQYYGLGIVL